MLKNTVIRRANALTKTHKISAACVATLGAATLAFTAAPSEAAPTAHTSVASASVALGNQAPKGIKASVTDQMAPSLLKAEAIATKAKAASLKKAAQQHATRQAADRSAQRPAVKPAAPKAKSYANNLDGWIRESLDIMAKKGIPGSYNGLHRNIMRESSGNPAAINNWDINARNGIPSKGLLQVIPPTFSTYHVHGTSANIYDPVANITAAANYAAHRYGSIDNVNSAY
ncbi:transglycosylase SLT domain-containing protein [Streptomyces nodosus]|uniref:transglycosylase SLT domain-containing protein n=1 Tax=Streptomyces nodosus TaxID=40318 RepID=UPI0034516F94